MLEDNLLLGLSLAGIGATVVFVIVVNFFIGREVKKTRKPNSIISICSFGNLQNINRINDSAIQKNNQIMNEML
jgi:hypothetical protein